MLDLAALDPGVLLELAPRRAKRVRDGDVHVLVSWIESRIATHRDHSIRHCDVEANVEGLAVTLPTMGDLDHDLAPQNPRVGVLDAIDPALDRRLDCRTCGHAAKRDLDGNRHDLRCCTDHASAHGAWHPALMQDVRSRRDATHVVRVTRPHRAAGMVLATSDDG